MESVGAITRLPNFPPGRHIVSDWSLRKFVFIFRRLLQTLGVLLAVSLVVFMGLYAVGNPADILLPDDATAAERATAIRSLGLDRPIWVQYGLFLKNALSGDLGTSFVYNTPSIELIFQRFPATLELALSALIIAVVLGVPLGLYAGLNPEPASIAP